MTASERQKLMRIGHRFAGVFFLLQTMQAFNIVDRVVYGEWYGRPGTKITEALNILLITTSLALFVRGLPRIWAIRSGSALFLAVAGFLLLSTLWSIDPDTTLRRGFLYLVLVVGTIGLVGNLDGDELMDLVMLSSGVAAAASLLLLAAVPHQAVMYPLGELRGVFPHKNVLGAVMAAGVLASLHCIRLGRRRRTSAVLLLLFAILAILSRSVTSLLIIVTLCTASGVVALLRRSGVRRLVGLYCAIVGAICLPPIATLVMLHPASVIEAVGRDPTLTGRTELWPFVLNDIAQNPILGWGYSAFWSPRNPAAVEISYAVKWHVPEAHNGILEMLLNIGAGGASIYGLLWIRNFYLGLRCLDTAGREMGVTAILCCAAIVLTGISETVLLEPFQLSTSLFFMTGLVCERTIRSRRCRPRRVRAALPSQPRLASVVSTPPWRAG
ncbi:MAG TPA: O-antigen ligase family protein [Stellaceae bacterium]|jgi:O-antigen ligase